MTMPIAATTKIDAAEVMPRSIPISPRNTRPPPMNPMPVSTPAIACGDDVNVTAVTAAAPVPTKE